LYHVLIVDDEPIAIRGLLKGIDWPSLGFEPPFEAYDAEDAKDILQSQQIDVMICDIEMPGMNGLNLLEWINERLSSVQTIFLTGHASFTYAQQAIKQGSLDYLLKPVDHAVLEEVVMKALERIEEEKKRETVHEHFQHYQSLWQKQLPVVTERLWQDILQYRILPKKDVLEQHFTEYELPLNGSSHVLPILISVEQWQAILNPRDEEIMAYALRKAADEMFLEKHPGIVVPAAEGLILVLLYGYGEHAPMKGIADKAREYVQFGGQHFRCKLSCYIAEPTPVTQITIVYESLLSLERANVSQPCTVQLLDKEPLPQMQLQSSPVFTDWGVLLEMGKEQELLLRFDESMEKLFQINAAQESMDAFYFGLINLLYQVFHKKGIFIRDVFEPALLEELFHHPRSLLQLQTNAKLLLTSAVAYLNRHHRGRSALLIKVQQYIDEHLTHDISREDIAGHVCLNAAYLSRWFKKETGRSLSEYVLEAKIEKAKTLLVNGNLKVSSIAEALGYLHFSHFAKIFRNATGLTPQEFRKQFQQT
jgi:two-component system, response regulator YesN